MTQTCQGCLAQSAMPGVIAEGEWRSAGLVCPLVGLQPQQSSTELFRPLNLWPQILVTRAVYQLLPGLADLLYLPPQGAFSLCTCSAMKLPA